MPNDQLFVDVLVQIERHPETWNQRTYCGTARCFAGWACNLIGRTAENWDVGGVASQALGIDEWGQGRNHLFNANNTLDDLYRISASLMGIDEVVLRDKVQAAL